MKVARIPVQLEHLPSTNTVPFVSIFLTQLQFYSSAEYFAVIFASSMKSGRQTNGIATDENDESDITVALMHCIGFIQYIHSVYRSMKNNNITYLRSIFHTHIACSKIVLLLFCTALASIYSTLIGENSNSKQTGNVPESGTTNSNVPF